MAFAQQVGDRHRYTSGVSSLVDRDRDRVQVPDSQQPLSRRERDEHGFVLVGVVGAEVASDPKRAIADRDPFSNRIEAFAEEAQKLSKILKDLHAVTSPNPGG